MTDSTKIFWKDLLKVLLASLILAAIIRWLVFLPFRVEGASMEDNFSTNDYLIVDKFSARFNKFTSGEVVVFKFKNTGSYYIKRIIGLPGDVVEVKNGQVYVNDELLDESAYLKTERRFTPHNTSVSLGKGQYFVLGDNRLASSDSRNWGVLDGKAMVGRVWFRLMPLRRFQIF